MNETCLDHCSFRPSCLDSCIPGGSTISAGEVVTNIVITLCLLVMSAFFSGLTLGLMSLDISGLELIIACGDDVQQALARRILPLRKRGNLLLCTLLLGNTAVNSFIAITTADLTAGLAGAIISTAFILIFGEIVPQSVCSKYGLQIGAMSVHMVRFFIALFFPIAWPISKFLDCALGRELRIAYNRKELDKLLSIAVEDPISDLRPEEKYLMSAALAFADKRVDSIMTKLDHTFCVEVSSRLSFEALLKCYKSGFTRIPVYRQDPSCVVGLLFAKDLILVDPDDELPVGAMLSFCGRPLHTVRRDATLDKLLSAAQTLRSHLFFVVDSTADVPALPARAAPPIDKVVGIVTLEDVLEELIAAEIVDEDDSISDNRTRAMIKDAEQTQMRNKRMEFFYAIQARRHPRRHISDEELRAITTFLIANAEPFARINVTHKAIRKLLTRCPVLTVEASSAHHGVMHAAEPLYERGEPASQCCLVLSGQLRISAGADGVEVDAGPWSLLALEALEKDPYKPDYKAEVMQTARLLFISRDNYKWMLAQAGGAAGFPPDSLALSAAARKRPGITGSGPLTGVMRAAGATNASIELARPIAIDDDVDADHLRRSSGSPLALSRGFDWDASVQRTSGAARLAESGSAMLSRSSSRPNVFFSRSYDDHDGTDSDDQLSRTGMSRSQSHPELVDDQGNAKPLVALLDEALRREAGRAPAAAAVDLALFRPPVPRELPPLPEARERQSAETLSGGGSTERLPTAPQGQGDK